MHPLQNRRDVLVRSDFRIIGSLYAQKSETGRTMLQTNGHLSPRAQVLPVPSNQIQYSAGIHQAVTLVQPNQTKAQRGSLGPLSHESSSRVSSTIQGSTAWFSLSQEPKYAVLPHTLTDEALLAWTTEKTYPKPNSNSRYDVTEPEIQAPCAAKVPKRIKRTGPYRFSGKWERTMHKP